MLNRRNRWFAGLAGTSLAIAMTATTFAYVGGVAGAITVGGPSGTLKCGVALTVTATVVDAAGQVIAGKPVDWKISSSPSSADEISSTPTTTDDNGRATTSVTLACVAGDRTVTASADDISAGAVLSIGDGAVLGITAPGSAPGLPRTSTVLEGSPLDSLPIATILALLAILAGGGIIVRRLAFSPR